MGMEQYGNVASRGGATPVDTFTHAKYILDPEREIVATFQALINREILLANISDKVLMRLEQTQIFNLHHNLDMAIREPEVCGPVFKYMYYSWKGSLALTRAFNGKERELQASVGGYGGQPLQDGYGMGAQPDEVEGKLFDKIAALRPQKKNMEG